MSLQKFKTIIRYFKIFALLVFFLIKCNFLFAQKDLTDSAKTYEYWSKRGVIEVVYAYMNDYITTVTDSSLPKEKIKNCTKEKTGLKEYEKQFVSPLDSWEVEVITSKLNELSTYLKNNNWVGAEKNILQPLFSNLNSKKALNHEFFSTLKPTGNERSTVIPGYTNKMSNWNKTVERIITEYNNDLKKIRPVKDSGIGSTVPANSLNNSGVETPIQPPVNPLEKNWLIIVLSSLLSFLVGVSIVYYLIKSRVYYFLDDDVETYKQSISHSGLFSFLSIIRLLKIRKDVYKNKVAELERKIEKLEKKSLPENNSTSKTSGDPVDIEKSSAKAEYPANSIEWDLSKEGGNKTSLYFSIPENDGRFIIDKGEQTNDGSKYYKIEYRNNSDEGDLFYISGIQDKRAINRLDSYLKPVCDIDNIINADNAVKIELLKPGKVIKIGASWVIDPTYKVKIKLV